MNPILIVLRIILPLILIPRWPLLGGAVAIFLDNIDWGTKQLFGMDPVFEYQAIDKILDTFYLALLAITSLRWKDRLARNVSIFLFSYRLLGVLLFEITHIRWVLFVFPNIFENFFFTYLVIQLFTRNRFKLHIKWLAIILFIVSIPKMLQEYSIHIVQQNLIFDVFGMSLEYRGTWMQIVYVLLFCAVVAFVFRKKTASKK